MQLLNTTQLTEDIAIIQLMHGRLGKDLADSLAYHTGNLTFLRDLNRRNMLIGNYLDILRAYDIVGDEVVTLAYNVLSIAEIESIIDDCYRSLNKYNY